MGQWSRCVGMCVRGVPTAQCDSSSFVPWRGWGTSGRIVLGHEMEL